MNKTLLPLGMKCIIGAWLSIIFGIIMTSIAVGFEFFTVKNIDQSLSSSILDGAITLSVGYLLYLFARSVIGKHSAEFTLETLPYIALKIEEAHDNHSITSDEVSNKQKQLLEYIETMLRLDGFTFVIGRSYILIVVIFMILCFVADYKPIDIDVGKFAIFETVTMIGLYFTMIIYMYIINKQANELV